jgi:restriction system protein
MRERLASGPRIVRTLFAAILVLGFPIAIALPQDLNGKVYASGAVVLIAAAAAILAAALVRRRKAPSDASRAAAPRWSLELLRRLEWRRFEELCAAYYEVAGTADQPSSVVQCKPWSDYTVGIKAVRELRAAMAAAGVPQGVLVACGTFTSEAKEFSRGENIQLIDGGELLRKIGALAPEQGQALLTLATEGDFSTPTCPACGIKMTARSSSTEGRKFWGCLNYPRCKRTFFGASNAPA